MTEEIQIQDIIFDPSLQVRSAIYPQRVEYLLDVMEASGRIPPIMVAKDSQGYVLIDGWHRMEAARRLDWTKIEAKIEDIPEEQRLFRAWKANDKSPMPPTRQERDDYIIRLAQLGWNQEEIAREVGLSRPRIAQIIGNVSINIPDTRRLKPSDRMEALRYYLQGCTQKEIAREFNVAQSTLSGSLSKLIREITGAYKSGRHKWDVAETYGLDEDEIDKVLLRDGDPLNIPLPQNTWWPAFGLHASQQKYPGATPLNMAKSILAYFTKPGEHIVDPMAGSGTIGVACRDMVGRRCQLFDLTPPGKPLFPITPHNLRGKDGQVDLPPTQKPDLVFLDPPYSNIGQKKYDGGKDDLSLLKPKEFVGFMGMLLLEIKTQWAPCRVVILMANLRKEGHIYDLPSQMSATLTSAEYRLLDHIVNEYGWTESTGTPWPNKARQDRWLLRNHIHIIVGETS